MKRILIVYYSWSNGNTKRIAEEVQKATGADMVRIETVVPYPTDYNTTVDQAQEEVKHHFRPEICPLEADVADYDVIVVGTPAWWYTMAPAVAAFLEKTDFRGKTVIPFMTNGGWPGHVLADMEGMCKGAEVLSGKEIRFDSEGGDHLITKQSDIDRWIASVKKICTE